jgi:uracil-DNA glycosylase
MSRAIRCNSRARALDALVADIRACRLCRDSPTGRPLPHEPRPVLRVSATARIGVFSQAPGTRVHASGKPFTDPSGVRLRSWMGVTDDEFYDASRIAIVPMGFCFPGLDAKGGDLPPRRECAPLWRARLMGALPDLDLVLLVGQYAQRWHLGTEGRSGLTDIVQRWRELVERPGRPILVPLPHPSWRNNGWIRRNPWFDAELVPWLREAVRKSLLPRPS